MERVGFLLYVIFFSRIQVAYAGGSCNFGLCFLMECKENEWYYMKKNGNGININNCGALLSLSVKTVQGPAFIDVFDTTYKSSTSFHLEPMISAIHTSLSPRSSMRCWCDISTEIDVRYQRRFPMIYARGRIGYCRNMIGMDLRIEIVLSVIDVDRNVITDMCKVPNKVSGCI